MKRGACLPGCFPRKQKARPCWAPPMEKGKLAHPRRIATSSGRVLPQQNAASRDGTSVHSAGLNAVWGHFSTLDDTRRPRKALETVPVIAGRPRHHFKMATGPPPQSQKTKHFSINLRPKQKIPFKCHARLGSLHIAQVYLQDAEASRLTPLRIAPPGTTRQKKTRQAYLTTKNCDHAVTVGRGYCTCRCSHS